MKLYFITGIILAGSFFYAIVRYHILKGVAWEHLPLFISNKALSLSAVVLIALSYGLGSFSHFFPRVFSGLLAGRKFFGLAGFSLASVHALISLIIFSPSYYPKFFAENGQLNVIGEFSMLFGVLSFFVFTIVAVSSIPTIAERLGTERFISIQRTGYLGLVLVFFHVLTMGYEGWLVPAGWPGGLLPISLIAATCIAMVLLVRLSALIDGWNMRVKD